ncbi:MAG: mechanosensitive ion channel [Verrucomicrobiae bacterium]|nr:mechanosensitive ion channel [Verrucomicrobiae bacterium]
MIRGFMSAAGEGAERLVDAAAAMAAQPVDDFWEWFFRARVFEARVADLAKFGAFIIAGIVLGRLLRIPVTRWLERFASGTDREPGRKIGRGIERAVSLLIFSIVLGSGAIDVLHLPGWAWEKARHLPTVLMAVASTMLFLQLVEIALVALKSRGMEGRSQADESLVGFIRKGVRFIVILVAALVIADNLGFKVTGIVAGLGVGGAALALAAQNLIANFLGTLEIVADRLYGVGDRIEIEKFDGFVEQFGLRSTKIRAITGERIIVPNKKMADTQMRNHSRNGNVRTVLSFRLAYGTPHERLGEAIRLLDEILAARNDVDSRLVTFKTLGVYSLEIEVILWARYKTWPEYNTLLNGINGEIKKRFDAAGIAFALPAQTLRVERERPPAEGSVRPS